MMNVALIILFAPLLICWALWLLFAVLAAVPARRRLGVAGGGGGGGIDGLRIDVLIPAHDEEFLLPRLLETLRVQRRRSGLIGCWWWRIIVRIGRRRLRGRAGGGVCVGEV